VVRAAAAETSGLSSGASRPPRSHIDVVTRGRPHRGGARRLHYTDHAHYGHRLLPHSALTPEDWRG